jgi:ferredoxin-type protein NapH
LKNVRRFCLLISFLLLPVTLNYFSPYLIVDGIVNKIAGGAFFIWTLMFISSLIFGRAFCSYVCPYGGEQMILDRAIEKPLKRVELLKKLRITLGVLWITAIIVLLIVKKGFIRADFLYLTEQFVSGDNWMKLVGYYVIAVGILILPLIMGKRASCHYLCPMSILNITGTKIKNKLNIPSLRLSSNSGNCKSCRSCNKVCPMSLDVMGMVKSGEVDSTECILCGECSKVCAHNAISRIYGRKQKIKGGITPTLSK